MLLLGIIMDLIMRFHSEVTITDLQREVITEITEVALKKLSQRRDWVLDSTIVVGVHRHDRPVFKDAYGVAHYNKEHNLAQVCVHMKRKRFGDVIGTLLHELVHIHQYMCNDLCTTSDGVKIWKGKVVNTHYTNMPWEHQANDLAEVLLMSPEVLEICFRANKRGLRF